MSHGVRAEPCRGVRRRIESGANQGFQRAVRRPGRAVHGGQPAEGERGEQQSEVTQCDIVEVWVAQQVDDDAGEPGGEDVGRIPRFDIAGSSHPTAHAELDPRPDRCCVVVHHAASDPDRPCEPR